MCKSRIQDNSGDGATLSPRKLLLVSDDVYDTKDTGKTRNTWILVTARIVRVKRYGIVPASESESELVLLLFS